MRRDLKWDDIRLFLAAMRERTLSGAAARLGVDASTVSRRLAAFEESAGAPLFDRTREGLSPTAAAEALLTAAEDMEAAAYQVARAADGWESAPEGLVRITCFPGFADAFLVPLLPSLVKAYPRLRFSLDTSTEIADLSRREADMALRLLKPQSGDLLVTRLVTLRYALLTSPKTPLRAPRDLSDLPWIGWAPTPGQNLASYDGATGRASAPYAPNPLTDWLSRFAPAASPVLVTTSIAAQLAAIEGGMGVALLPRVYLSLRDLHEIPLTGAHRAAAEALPEMPVWLVGHRALRSVPRISVVWNHLLEGAQQMPQI